MRLHDGGAGRRYGILARMKIAALAAALVCAAGMAVVTAAAGSGASQQLIRGWTTYSAPDSTYSISFPRMSTPTAADDTVTWRGAKLTGRAYRVRESDRQWSVLRVPNVTYPALTTRERRLAQALDAYAEWVAGGLQESGGRMVGVRPVTVGRHPGRHMVMVLASGNTVERRVVLADSTLYLIEFAIAAGASAGLDGDMFIASFSFSIPIGAIELPR